MHCLRVETGDQLRDHYWLLEEACERLTARENRLHFAPDIYAAVMRGDAQMTVVVDEAPVGLMVTQPDRTPDNHAALRVWIAYAVPGAGSEALPTGMHEAELMAVEQGFGHMIFGTQRCGWLRRAKELGYELSEYTFTREIHL